MTIKRKRGAVTSNDKVAKKGVVKNERVTAKKDNVTDLMWVFVTSVFFN